MNDALARKTLQLIDKALQSHEGAQYSEVIKIIHELSTRAYAISIKELTDLISRDVSVTAKIISAANTLAYNPTGVVVNTVTQAVQLIGFEKVRNLALALLLLENAESSLSPNDQREVATIALSSGIIAREVMDQRQTNDPELAFVCATLRSYGRLLMATFLTKDYQRAKALSDEIGSQDDAFREVFGLTPVEVSYHLLETANLPKVILQTLKFVGRATLEQARESRTLELRVISDFANKYADLAISSGQTPGEFQKEAIRLGRSYGAQFGLDGERISNLLNTLDTTLRAYSRNYGGRIISDSVLGKLKSRASTQKEFSAARQSSGEGEAEDTVREEEKDGPREKAYDRAAEAGGYSAEPETGAQRQKGTADEAVPQKDWLMEGIMQLTELLGRSPVSLNRMWDVIVEVTHKALKLDDCILFIRSPDGNKFAPVAGVGALFREERELLRISPQNKDVLSLSMHRMEDVLIENARNPRTLAYMPDWVKQAGTRSFACLILALDDSCYGMLWCGRQQPPALALDADTRKKLKAMRIHLNTACRLAGK